jgi:hypothetical protein
VIALDLPLNKKVSVLSVTSVGAGQWDVKVHCGDTPDIRNIDQVEYQLDIWGYGLAPTIAGRYGLAIFDKTGALAWDLTRDNPLFARSFHSLDDSSVQAIPPLTRPVAVGLPSTDYITDEFVSINRWAVRRSMGALNRTDATTIRGAIFTAQRYEYSNPGEPIEHAQGTSYPANVFIVEGANLP